MKRLAAAIATIIVVATAGYLILELQAESGASAETRGLMRQLGSMPEVSHLNVDQKPPEDFRAPPAPPSVDTGTVAPPDARDQNRRIGAIRRNFLRSYPGIDTELLLNAEELDLLAQGDSGYVQLSMVEAYLGPGRYEQYLDRKASNQRDRLRDSLRTGYEVSGLRLSDVQTTQLSSVMNSELRRQFAEDNDRTVPNDAHAVFQYRDETLAMQEATHRRIIEAAQGFLTAEQLIVLQSSLLGPVRQHREALLLERAQLDLSRK